MILGLWVNWCFSQGFQSRIMGRRAPGSQPAKHGEALAVIGQGVFQGGLCIGCWAKSLGGLRRLLDAERMLTERGGCVVPKGQRALSRVERQDKASPHHFKTLDGATSLSTVHPPPALVGNWGTGKL
jgi:hypothetical protein